MKAVLLDDALDKHGDLQLSGRLFDLVIVQFSFPHLPYYYEHLWIYAHEKYSAVKRIIISRIYQSSLSPSPVSSR